MKHPADQLTPELPGIPGAKKRGRPATGKAKSDAERMKAYRERKNSQANKSEQKKKEAMDLLQLLLSNVTIIGNEDCYKEARGYIFGLCFGGLITEEEKERAHEWIYEAWTDGERRHRLYMQKKKREKN